MQLSKIKEYLEFICCIVSSSGLFYLAKRWGLDGCEIILLIIFVFIVIFWVSAYCRSYELLSFPAILATISILIVCISAWYWFHSIVPFANDELGIYVARFEGDYGTEYREEIFQALNSAVERAGLTKQVRVQKLPRKICGDKGNAKALVYGLKGDAKLVIWGTFPSEKKVRAWITFTDPHYFFMSGSHWRLGPEGEITLSSNLSEVKVPEELIKKPLSLVNLVVALSFARAGEHGKAILKLEEILKTDIDFAEIHYFLGNEYEEKGDYEKAIQAYKVAMDLSIKKELLYTLSGVGLAGVYIWQINDIEKAIEILKRVLQSHQDSPIAHSYLGTAYSIKKMYKVAEGELKTAIELFPNYAGAHWGLGAMYENEGKYDMAIQQYKRTLQINSNYEADGNIRIVVCCAKKGELELAVETWKAAMEREPDYMFYQRLGSAYYELGLPKDAIKAFKKAVEIKPDYFFSHFFIGITYFKQAQLKEAIESYLKLQELQRNLSTELFLYYRRLVVSDKDLVEKMRDQVKGLNWEERKVAEKLLIEPKNLMHIAD